MWLRHITSPGINIYTRNLQMPQPHISKMMLNVSWIANHSGWNISQRWMKLWSMVPHAHDLRMLSQKNYRGKAICVEGVGKALHTSGLISGSLANTGTVHCGGFICRPISGLFTKNNLKHDYVHVATIPAGASNISITELKNSDNFWSWDRWIRLTP